MRKRLHKKGVVFAAHIYLGLKKGCFFILNGENIPPVDYTWLYEIKTFIPVIRPAPSCKAAEISINKIKEGSELSGGDKK